MTTSLPQPRALSLPVVCITLRDEAVLLGVRATTPDEGEREELAIVKTGREGLGTSSSFPPLYSSGWGDGSGRPLSPRALESFYRFWSR